MDKVDVSLVDGAEFNSEAGAAGGGEEGGAESCFSGLMTELIVFGYSLLRINDSCEY